jgi:Putative Actinobacterial Holin-X, holin superfamily III
MTGAYRRVRVGSVEAMAVPGIDHAGERALDELVQNASKQAVVLAREQLDVARQELIARAKADGPGIAMLSGGALLGALASATGTAALVLMLGRRPRMSVAALGVTGAYAGAGTLLAREGLVRLRQAGPPRPDVTGEEEPAQDTKERPSAKAKAGSAAKAARRTKASAESRLQPPGRPKPKPKRPTSRRRTPAAPVNRTRRRAT